MNTAIQMNATAAAKRVPSFYARVTALGFGLVALTGVVILILGPAGGGAGEELGFALAFIIVGLLVAGAVWRLGRWALVLAAVLSLALLGLVGPFSLFSLSHPESATDFIPVVLMLAGALLGLIGSAVALMQGRRGTLRESATSTERSVLGIALGAVALAVLLSMVLTATGRTTVSAQAKTGAAAVQMKNYMFAPNSVQVKAGDSVRVVVKNDDSTLHTFTLPQAGVDVTVAPGSEKVVEFKAPAAGVYQWYCTPHSNSNGATREGMVGILQVQ